MNKIVSYLRKTAQNPALKNALVNMKPEKSIWGFLGVILFFIVPEIVAFVWGGEIVSYAKAQLLHTSSSVDRYYFESLIELFETGSYLNLSIGILLCIWLFY